MEIRCAECGHLGAAEEARPVDGGVGLVCAQCGHVNVIAMGGDAPEPPAAPDGSDGSVERTAAERREDNIVKMVQRLIPVPGSGLRCLKCAHLLAYDSSNCSRCGLVITSSGLYDEERAPWEAPPPGKEDVQEQAGLVWEALIEGGASEEMEKFVDFVIEEDLVDFGIRKIQHFLVDHQDHDAALAGLRRLAVCLDRASRVVHSQAEASAEAFSEDVQRLRSGLLKGALIFWVVILLLLMVAFSDKF